MKIKQLDHLNIFMTPTSGEVWQDSVNFRKRIDEKQGYCNLPTKSQVE